MANIIKTEDKRPSKKKNQPTRRRRQVVAVVIGVVVIVGAACVYLLVQNQSSIDSEQSEPVAQENEFAARSARGEVGNAEVEEVLNSNASDAEKAEQLDVYVSHALLNEDLSDDDKREIIDVAIRGYELNEIVNLLWVITETAEDIGDTETYNKYQPILDAKLSEMAEREGFDGR